MEFNVRLTAAQIEVLLAILDCATEEWEPDWFLHEGVIKTPFREGGDPRTVQEHLNRMLRKELYPEIFGEQEVSNE